MVTYHPDADLPGRIARIAGQVSRVYVVDNASGDAARRMLAGIARADPRAEPILLDTNEGVGAALNRACERAIADGFGWIVTLDQDSLVEPSLVADLASIRAEHPRPDAVLLVAAGYVLGDARLDAPPGGRRWIETPTAITSGSLVSLEAYRRVGPFREDYFIDSVDDEFCLRLRRDGGIVLRAVAPLMRHSLGKGRRHRILGREVTVSHHPAFRRYYMMRNQVLTLRAYGLREPRWAVLQLLRMARNVAALLLLEEDRRTKLRAACAGLWDGLRGRAGRSDRSF